MTEMKQNFNLTDIWYLDFWPFGPGIMFLTGPDAAALPVSLFPQHDMVASTSAGTIGSSSIKATSGPLWEMLHRTIAPALTPAATRSHFDSFLDRAVELSIHLESFIEDGVIPDLHFEVGRYPLNVLAGVFFGEKLTEETYRTFWYPR